MSGRRPGRAVAWTAAALLALLLGVVAFSWREIAVRYQVHRLEEDPAELAALIEKPEGSTGREAVLRFCRGTRGARALAVLILKDLDYYGSGADSTAGSRGKAPGGITLDDPLVLLESGLLRNQVDEFVFGVGRYRGEPTYFVHTRFAGRYVPIGHGLPLLSAPQLRSTAWDVAERVLASEVTWPEHPALRLRFASTEDLYRGEAGGWSPPTYLDAGSWRPRIMVFALHAEGEAPR